MPINAEDREEVRAIIKSTPLSAKHLYQLEDRFVTKIEYDTKTAAMNKKLLQGYTDLAVIKFQNKLILGILAFVGAAIGGT